MTVSQDAFQIFDARVRGPILRPPKFVPHSLIGPDDIVVAQPFRRMCKRPVLRGAA